MTAEDEKLQSLDSEDGEKRKLVPGSMFFFYSNSYSLIKGQQKKYFSIVTIHHKLSNFF